MKHLTSEKGISYLLLLLNVSLMGIALMVVSHEYKTVVRRENEAELLFRGDQILKAIKAYNRDHQQGVNKRFPASLEELLYDDTGLNSKRYLRKLFKDPFSADGRWGLKMNEYGEIKGVFSNSGETPIKEDGFPEDYKNFTGAKSYSAWVFEVKQKKTLQNNTDKSGKQPPGQEVSF